MTKGHWQQETGPLREQFSQLLDADRLRELHKTSGFLHAIVAVRQVLLGVVAAQLVIWSAAPYVWIPAAVVLGFVVFSLTVLLHEVVHQAVFARRNVAANRILAWLYAIPSGLAPSQFTRWHLDHHAELGTTDRDPKRHHLTPKRVKRWIKALYLTPALFPIYFRAAARESSGYEPALLRRMRVERLVVFLVHGGVMAAIVGVWGGAMLLKLYVLPVFFVFPVAFTINRLGQHYDVEPSDPAAWGTIIKSNFIWDLLFVWSSYHMEHHYFPGVPCYHLPALHRELKPVLERHPMRVRTYGGLCWDWFVRNRQPHANWE